MTAARTSASSGLIDQQPFGVGLRRCDLQQWDEFAGAGQGVLDQAVVRQLGEFLDTDPGVPQRFHRGPGPERPVLLAGQVAALPGALGPRPRPGFVPVPARRRCAGAVNVAPGVAAVRGLQAGCVVDAGGRAPAPAAAAGPGAVPGCAGPCATCGRGSPSAGPGPRRGSGTAPPTAPTGPGPPSPTGRCRGRTRAPRPGCAGRRRGAPGPR